MRCFNFQKYFTHTLTHELLNTQKNKDAHIKVIHTRLFTMDTEIKVHQQPLNSYCIFWAPHRLATHWLWDETFVLFMT